MMIIFCCGVSLSEHIWFLNYLRVVCMYICCVIDLYIAYYVFFIYSL